MDEKERQEFDLEDIIKEFGGKPRKEKAKEPAEPEVLPEAEPEVLPEAEPETKPEEPEEILEDLPWPEPKKEEPEALDQTRRIQPVHTEKAESETSGDTIRLTGLRGQISEKTPKEPAELGDTQDKIWNPGDTIHSEPFSEQWEPEYEQPIGEYVPPQPIQFHPKDRLHEMKKKLVAGPEKRFYKLSEKGIGRLQAAIFLSLLVVLICAASTVMYALGMVEENRLRLMVFGQFWGLLVSALLGSFQLIEGLADLKHKKFTLNTLLVVTFVVCCVDGILCLKQVRVSCCAAFSLAMTMSLWSTYERRSKELSQMDTMRKASRLNGVAACQDYLDGKKGLLRKEGQVEDFMDTYAAMGKPEKRLNVYGLIAMIAAFGIGIAAGVMNGFSAGVQVTAVSLLAAIPASAFICQSRPAWILERRLHRLGTVLCGWQGVEGLSGKVVFPVTFEDICPTEAVRLNGVKYFGNREPEQVMAYAAAVVTADGCGLADLFAGLLDSHNGRHYDASDLLHYENGGLSGVVEGETVLLGSVSFMKDMDIEVPENARVSYGVYVAIEGELSGLYAVNYEKTQSAAAGLSTLNSYRGLQCVLTSNAFMLTHGFMRSKFGIKPKRFLIPEHETRDTLRQKELPEDAPTLLMTTALGLASVAYAVTGARVLRSTCRLGTVLHIIGGVVGLGIMLLLVILGALDLITPVNMFLYQLVWLIPALLITEWTQSI